MPDVHDAIFDSSSLRESDAGRGGGRVVPRGCRGRAYLGEPAHPAGQRVVEGATGSDRLRRRCVPSVSARLHSQGRRAEPAGGWQVDLSPFRHPLGLAALVLPRVNDNSRRGAGLVRAGLNGKLSDSAVLLTAPIDTHPRLIAKPW